MAFLMQPKVPTWQKICSLLLCLSVGACHTMAPLESPVTHLPLVWQTDDVPAGKAVVASDWWKNFNSPQLNQLIVTALEKNPDLHIAAERVRQAELQMAIANSSLFPALDLSGSSGTTRRREGNDWDNHKSSQVSLGVHYEIDLWGRLAAQRAGAKALYLTSEYDYVSVQLSLASGVAIAWFRYLALQQQIQTTEENLRIAQRVHDIVEVRYRNGVATAADRARQRTNLLTQEAMLPPLQLQLRQTRAAVAVLLGEIPQNFHLADEELLTLALPSIAPGQPLAMVVRRPDIASVEAQLAAAAADVGAARAALLPAVHLSALAGRAATGLFSLNEPADTLSWTLSLAQSLFDAGRLRNQSALSESRRLALVAQYRKVILIALQEVDDALDRTNVNTLLEEQQVQIVIEAQRALTLTEARYREGSDDLLALLDAQRSLFQARDQLAQQRLARLISAVDLYKALGGGWQVDPE